MKPCIAIGCHYGNAQWLDELLASINVGLKYPVVFVVNESPKAPKQWLDQLYEFAHPTGGEVLLRERNAFSPGVLDAAVDAGYTDILHLHDSVVIKNTDMFRIIFEDLPQHSVSLSHGFLMFMGKYKADVLRRVGIPSVNTKREEHSHEFSWTGRYIQAARPYMVELWPSWTDGDVFVEKFGQKRMVLENEYIKKYKGTWDASMIKD